jgi:hypothetical protein
MAASDARRLTSRIVDLGFGGQRIFRDVGAILSKSATSARGQNAKYSRGANNFRCYPNNGHSPGCRETAYSRAAGLSGERNLVSTTTPRASEEQLPSLLH